MLLTRDDGMGNNKPRPIPEIRPWCFMGRDEQGGPPLRCIPRQAPSQTTTTPGSRTAKEKNPRKRRH